MENNDIREPNFVVLKRVDNIGPIYRVTICKKTLNILSEEVLNTIPNNWSANDLHELLDEGRRFFEGYN